MRKTYEMSAERHDEILKESNGGTRKRLNFFWARLSVELGFHVESVRPIEGMSTHHFTAEPINA